MNLVELTEALSHYEKIFGSRFEFLLFQIGFYAEHPHQRFDVTFYDREPLLEVALTKDFARKWRAGRRKALINRIVFSDGTIVSATEIWTLNPMPRDLDIANVDLAQGEQVGAANGETIREVIRNTYRCKSRAEEDFFLARWIVS
jgi:hypothetical protein